MTTRSILVRPLGGVESREWHFTMGNGRTWPYLAPDELLDFDVGPRDKVDHVLLADAPRARALDRTRALEYVCTCFSR